MNDKRKRSCGSRTIAILFLIGLLTSNTISGGKSIPIVPTNGKSIALVVKGTEKTYFILTKKTPLTVDIDGPGKLTILSRLSLPSAVGSPQRYTMKVMEAERVMKENTSQTEKSDASYKNSNLIPGKSRKFTLDIPDGAHTYHVVLADAGVDEGTVKLLFARKKGKGSLVSLEPLSYDKVVTAMVAEKLIVYYVASKERGVQLRIVGPTRVRISTRLNYDAKMKGDQKYSLLMKEGDKQVLMKSMATSKSVGISYQEWKEVVPGKVNSFFIDVPKGEHTFTFAPGEMVGHSVSLKFSIPKKDLSNEE